MHTNSSACRTHTKELTRRNTAHRTAQYSARITETRTMARMRAGTMTHTTARASGRKRELPNLSKRLLYVLPSLMVVRKMATPARMREAASTS